MERQQILDIMRERGFEFNMESQSNGKTQSLYFLSKPVYHRRHKDRIIIPAFCCEVTVKGEFRLSYAIPKSINRLECGMCSPLSNEEHFFNICIRFQSSVQVLYEAFGEE